jgi:hypothetical protein
LNGIHQIIVSADGSKYAIQKNTKTLVFASKQIGLKVHAERTKYTVISEEHIAGQYHNIKTGNKYFESVEQFK